MKSWLTFALSVMLAIAVRAAELPNVIFILCDDLGYGDVGFALNERNRTACATIKTPNIDRLAEEGVILRDHYCASPVCIASRASILTGKSQMPGHCSVQHNEFDYPIQETNTLGTVMKAAGYHTMAIGKWGVGGKCGSTDEKTKDMSAHPGIRGFDQYYGFMYHGAGHTYYHFDGNYNNNFMGIYEWDGSSMTKASPSEYEGRYSTDLFIAKAKQYITDVVNDEVEPGSHKPFFLYLAVNTVHGSGNWNPTLNNTSSLHVPGAPYPESGVTWPLAEESVESRNTWIDPRYRHLAMSDNAKRYATTVSRLDDAMGDLMDHLETLGVADNTIIIFTSDNGPADEYGADTRLFNSAGDFDGLKRDVYEGGMRVPTFVYGPKEYVNGGTIDSTPSISVDWLATLADIGGLKKEQVPENDGVSLLPRLQGNIGEESKVELCYNANLFKPYGSSGYDDYTEFANRKGGSTSVRDWQWMKREGDIVTLRSGGTSSNQVINASDARKYNVVYDVHQDDIIDETAEYPIAIDGYDTAYSYSSVLSTLPYSPSGALALQFPMSISTTFQSSSDDVERTVWSLRNNETESSTTRSIILTCKGDKLYLHRYGSGEATTEPTDVAEVSVEGLSKGLHNCVLSMTRGDGKVTCNIYVDGGRMATCEFWGTFLTSEYLKVGAAPSVVADKYADGEGVAVESLKFYSNRAITAADLNNPDNIVYTGDATASDINERAGSATDVTVILPVGATLTVDTDLTASSLTVKGSRITVAGSKLVGNLDKMDLSKVESSIRYAGDGTLPAMPEIDTALTRSVEIAMPVAEAGDAKFTGNKRPYYFFDDGMTWTVNRFILGNDNGVYQRYEQRGGDIVVTGDQAWDAGQNGNGAALIFAHWPSTVYYMMSGGTFTMENAVGRVSVNGSSKVVVGGGEGTPVMTLKGLKSGSGGSGNEFAVAKNGTLVLKSGGLDFGSTHTFTLCGGTLRVAETATIASVNAITVDGDSTIDVPAGVTATVSAALSGSGTITKTGTGTLVLTGSLNFTDGLIVVEEGTVEYDGRSLDADSYIEVTNGTTARIGTLKTITLDVDGNATVKGVSDGDKVLPGEISFTVSTVDGYAVESVKVGGGVVSSVLGTYTVDVQGNITITVTTVASDTVYLTLAELDENVDSVVVAVGGEPVTVVDGRYPVANGGNVTITYTAKEGYAFEDGAVTKVLTINGINTDTTVTTEQVGELVSTSEPPTSRVISINVCNATDDASGFVNGDVNTMVGKIPGEAWQNIGTLVQSYSQYNRAGEVASVAAWDGSASETLDVGVKWETSQTDMGNLHTYVENPKYQYLKCYYGRRDGTLILRNPKITVSSIPYKCYDVIVYLSSTNSVTTANHPVKFNGTPYYGGTVTENNPYGTYQGDSNSWGSLSDASSLRYGGNVLRVDGMSSSTLALEIEDTIGWGIAAIQIAERPPILEHSEYISTDSNNPSRVFAGVSLSEIGTTYELKGKMGGAWVSDKSYAAVYHPTLDNGTLTVQFQKVDGDPSELYLKCVVVKFTEVDGTIYAYAHKTMATRDNAGAYWGMDCSAASGTPSTGDNVGGYGIFGLSLVPVAGQKIFQNYDTTNDQYARTKDQVSNSKITIPAGNGLVNGQRFAISSIQFARSDANQEANTIVIVADGIPYTSKSKAAVSDGTFGNDHETVKYDFDEMPILTVGTAADVSFFDANGSAMGLKYRANSGGGSVFSANLGYSGSNSSYVWTYKIVAKEIHVATVAADGACTWIGDPVYDAKPYSVWYNVAQDSTKLCVAAGKSTFVSVADGKTLTLAGTPATSDRLCFIGKNGATLKASGPINCNVTFSAGATFKATGMLNVSGIVTATGLNVDVSAIALEGADVTLMASTDFGESTFTLIDGDAKTAGYTLAVENNALVLKKPPEKLDPTDPDSAYHSDAATKEDAETEAKGAVVVPAEATSAVTQPDYSEYFTYKVESASGGGFTITINGFVDGIVEDAYSSAVEAAAGEADGDGNVTITVKPGLYYGFLAHEDLANVTGEPELKLATGDTEKVKKPGTTKGFIKVMVSSSPNPPNP